MSRRRKGGRGKGKGGSRRLALKIAGAALAALAIWAWAAVWFVHHSPKWIACREASWPRFATGPLLWLGNPVGDLLDALGVTGHDVVYEYDEEAPAGSVTFAGTPIRTGSPAPEDLRVIERGDYTIGWSDRLRHPVWVAYHVPPEVRFEAGERPRFSRDKSIPLAPPPSAYEKSHYDRGHMAPNYALATRFGPDSQRESFLMSNIAPQTAALNRGVWRDVEHRIADLWASRWGEIWVVVGAIPSETNEKLSGTGIDVPSSYYQVIVAQDGFDVRVMALVFDQYIAWNAWPARHLVTIDELEERTGLDFLPDLPDFIQSPLEAELPSRLWPIRLGDVFKLISLRLF